MKPSPEERTKVLLDKIGKEAFNYTEASWSNALIKELTELITKADERDLAVSLVDEKQLEYKKLYLTECNKSDHNKRMWEGGLIKILDTANGNGERLPTLWNVEEEIQSLLSAIQNAMKEKQ